MWLTHVIGQWWNCHKAAAAAAAAENAAHAGAAPRQDALKVTQTHARVFSRGILRQKGDGGVCRSRFYYLLFALWVAAPFLASIGRKGNSHV
jgi:hypothetical protein